MESTQQKVYIPRTNQKLEHLFSKGPFLHQLFDEQEKEKKKNQPTKIHSTPPLPIINEFTPLSQEANPFNKYQRELRGAEIPGRRGGGGAAAAVCNACGVPCCPQGQSREMMSGALPPPPLLVMTPASARPEEELTCVLLSWWLVEVMMLPGVLLVKVEVRLSKNIGGQYCLKQTTKSQETNCTRGIVCSEDTSSPHKQAPDALPAGPQPSSANLQNQAGRKGSQQPPSSPSPLCSPEWFGFEGT